MTSLSVIVPVYNNPAGLFECLSALQASCGPDAEIIVVDDGSTDDGGAVATRLGARVLRLATNSGPGVARNLGARHARGDVLLFVDADVVVAPDAVDRIRRVLAGHPEVAAVFGSYDARPRAPGLVSQYRNLLHHFVHQQGRPEASTFWAGCGAIRRSVFEEIGGFDEGCFARCIQDIELGYRLRAAGRSILLDREIQGTHLKRWTLRSMLRTDIFVRAIPWSRLILERGQCPDDLNVSVGQRLCVALVGGAVASLPLGVLRPTLLAVPAAAFLAVVAVNWRLVAFFLRERGAVFACGCLPLLLLYYFYSGLCYLYVWMEVRWRRPAVGGEGRTP